MVGVTGDPIERYLGRLRAELRTPAERTEQILSEAEDHLRESAAAGEAMGLTEHDAQEAAIAAFGPVRTVVRAHRRPMADSAVEVAMAAWKIAALYLLAVAGAGIALTIVFYGALGVHTVVHGHAHQMVVTAGPPDVLGYVAGVGGCAVAGLVLLLGYLKVRRFQRRRGQHTRALLGGYFPLAAAIFMLVPCPVTVLTVARFWHPSPPLPAAAVAGSVTVALGYAMRMGLMTVRRGGEAGTTDTEARYAR
jgi:hypothetical protein